jgi:hypothetical protein
MAPKFLILLAALLTPLLAVAPAGAQSTRNAVGQSERNSVDLKQGMTLAEVQTLLGRPRRTALKDGGGSAIVPAQGNLKWTYVWPGTTSSEKILNVEFVAKKPEEWHVSSWEWANY